MRLGDLRLSDVRFSDPYWLPVGLLMCFVLIGIWWVHDARQQVALSQFIAPQLRSRLMGSLSKARRRLRRGLLLVAVLLLCTALAGPLVGYHWEQIRRRGNEVVFALDTSRSMLTPDVKPDRLTRAKLAIDDMARELDGDGIGIVAFAGTAFLVCPLTLDYGAFHQSLDAIDVHTIPRGGTDIASAILAARLALSRHPGSDRILILVTDGENLEGDALKAAREAASQDGLRIYTVGVGTTGGDLIPLPSNEGGGSVQDETGAFVKSRLDEAGLVAIATATSGAYVHLGGQGEDFEAFLKTVFGSVTKHDLSYRQQKVYDQRYQWPLATALSVLLASLTVGTRRWSHRRAAAKVTRTVAVSAISILLGTLVVPVRSQSADQANDPRTGGDRGKPLVQYNAGTSAYRAGQFSQATHSFQQSIKTAPASDAKRLRDQEDAYYNLGNALYRAGQQQEKSAPQDAIQKWTEAVKAYDTALQLRASDTDSRFNRDLVNRKIDALRQPPDQGGGGGGGGGGGQSQGQGQGRGQGQPPKPPPQGQPPPPPQQASPDTQRGPADEGNDTARAPGQMSVEEARELLDSEKSDEHHSLGVPASSRDPKQTPDNARNW